MRDMPWPARILAFAFGVGFALVCYLCVLDLCALLYLIGR